MDINQLFEFANQQNASDLHISAGLPPMIRIDGLIRRTNVAALDQNTARDLALGLMTDFQRKEFEEKWEIDFSFDMTGFGRYRANVFYHSRGVGACFRAIPEEVSTLEMLGFGDIFKKIANTKQGLVLVTGPTGSGKSTTTAAMLEYINQNRQEHIIIIEDPIEFVHTSKKCLITQREVSRDTQSFSSALRAALREDPDIIVVGEMRDLETIQLALSAAETGHLVFGTLHTNSAAKTIDRLIDVFPAGEKEMVRAMVSESLEAVFAQTLLKKKDGSGRVAAHEILLKTSAISNLIREGKVAQMYSAMQTGTSLGMQTLDQALKDLVATNQISAQLAADRARDPSVL